MGFWDFLRRKNIAKPTDSVPRVLSREEFVAKLTQMTETGVINEDAEPVGYTLVMLSTSAAFQFRKPFYATVRSTTRELIDDLYQQYLRE